jgi:hypothetical protein
LGTAARTLVQENYSWTKVADDFARTLQEVVVAYNQARFQRAEKPTL